MKMRIRNSLSPPERAAQRKREQQQIRTNTPFVYKPPPTDCISKNALITIAVGPKYKWMFDITIRNMEAYCQHHGLQFICIDDTWRTDEHPCFLKQHVWHLLHSGRIKRACYIDSDMLIDPKAPNIFERVPEGRLGMYCENTHRVNYIGSPFYQDFLDYLEQYNELMFRYNERPVYFRQWDTRYYNAGLFVCDKWTCPHIPPVCNIMEIPSRLEHTAKGFYDQHYVNVMRIKHNIPMEDLEPEWNSFWTEIITKNKVSKKPFIIHFCGVKGKKVMQNESWDTFYEEEETMKMNVRQHFDKDMLTVNMVLGQRKEKWILERMRDRLLEYCPEDMQILSSSRALKGDNVLNVFWPYRCYEPCSGKFVTFHTHPERRPVWIESAKKAEGVIVMCDKYKQELIRDGIPESKITHIEPGIDSIFDYEVQLFFPCAMETHKHRKGYDLWQKIGNLPHVKTICTNGKWTLEQVAETMKRSDALFVSSLEEGGPISVLEALRSGIKVIAPYDVGLCGEFKDYILDYKKGDYKSASSVVQELVNEKERIANSVSHLSWKNYAELHYKLFRKILNENAD